MSAYAFRELIASIAVWRDEFESPKAACGLPARWAMGGDTFSRTLKGRSRLAQPHNWLERTSIHLCAQALASRHALPRWSVA